MIFQMFVLLRGSMSRVLVCRNRILSPTLDYISKQFNSGKTLASYGMGHSEPHTYCLLYFSQKGMLSSLPLSLQSDFSLRLIGGGGNYKPIMEKLVSYISRSTVFISTVLSPLSSFPLTEVEVKERPCTLTPRVPLGQNDY